jgi:hypothetical protein
VRTCSSPAWDEPSADGSFLTLFLGGILWVFFKLTNGGCQYWVSTDTNECGMKTMNMTIRHVASGTEFLANQSVRPG